MENAMRKKENMIRVLKVACPTVEKPLEKDNLSLLTRLKHRFESNKDFKIRLDADSIFGSFGNINFNIFYEPRGILVLYSDSNIEELVKELTIFMKGIIPICSYDMISKDEQTHVVEWDTFKPLARLNEIKAGAAHYRGTVLINFKSILRKNNSIIKGQKNKISNLEIKNDLRDPYFLSKSNPKQIKIKPVLPRAAFHFDHDIEKKVDPSLYDNYNEIDLFLAIKDREKIIKPLQNQITKSLSEYDTLEYNLRLLDVLILKTIKFNVQIEKPKDGQHVHKTRSFEAWLKYYSTYVNKMKSRDRDILLKLFRAQKDTSQFLPAKSWAESLLTEEKQQLV